jgi:hypothetical protein
MKKFISIIALALMITSSFVSCSEEEIKPKADNGNGAKEIVKGF